MARILNVAVFLLMLSCGALAQSRKLLINCNFNGKQPCNKMESEQGDQLLPWEMGDKQTPSDETGPTNGKDGDPSFLFMEATNKPVGATAKLVSEELGEDGDICVEFYYNMNGDANEMGKLELLVGGSIVWSASGDQGDQWLQHRETYNVNSDDKLTLVATRGQGYRSDIAIDNIYVTSSDCADTSSVVDPDPGNGGVMDPDDDPDGLPRVCEFDSVADDCNVIQDNDDRDDWIQWFDRTPSDFTGPMTGYTNSRGFIYYEATDKENGAEARFALANLIQSGSLSCARVEFYYHMYGYDMGSLRVYSRPGSDQSRATRYFVKDGEQGVDWLKGSFDLAIDTNTQIVFEAIRGIEYSSDIAIDNIKITDCSGTGPVDPPTPDPETPTPSPTPTTTTTTKAPTPRPGGQLGVEDTRLYPSTVFVDKYESVVTCSVKDVDYMSPEFISLEWYFPNGTKIVNAPGFKVTPMAWWANKTSSELGVWKTYLNMDNHLPYILNGDYQCKVRYSSYDERVMTTSIYFKGCAPGEFKCHRTNSCVPCGALCNGQNDCGDWADEFKCNMPDSPMQMDPVCSIVYPAS